MARYDQCDATCTTDCGHCKGTDRPDPAVLAVRESWPGTHFTRDGEAFVAPRVRDNGATARLIEHAVQVTREQVAREIEARFPDASSSGQRMALHVAARIARGEP